MRVKSIDKFDLLNNPGEDKPAYTIWFAGCSVQCNGCHNTDLWDEDNGIEMSPSDICFDLLHSEYQHETVILLGGEPLEQPSLEMELLLKWLWALKYNVFLYTSREIEDIDSNVLKRVHTLKTGKYDENLKQDGFPASTNQAIWHRYKPNIINRRCIYFIDKPANIVHEIELK